MACLNMQVNNEKQAAFMGPRISFSNDFGDMTHQSHHENSYTEAPVSSDFEFSVPSFASNSADEVFFRGKLPPLKESSKVVTLRDELLAGEEDEDDDGDYDIFLPRFVAKNSGWWREKFGLRKNSKKGVDHRKNLGGLESIDEAKMNPNFVNQVFNAKFKGGNQYK